LLDIIHTPSSQPVVRVADVANEAGTNIMDNMII
jgi:hypothetical protein